MIKLRVGRGAPPPLSVDGEPGHKAGDSVAQVAARLGVSVDDLVFLQIRDFGPGIERADLPRLTERFYRVDVEHSRKSGGTGLGLSVSYGLVRAVGGDLRARNDEGGGARFIVELPLA